MKKVIKSSLLLSSVLALCSCKDAEGNLLPIGGFSIPSGEEIVKKLIPSGLSFAVQLTAFIIIALAVIVFAYKPVAKYMKTRQDFIEGKMKSAKENEKIAEENRLLSEQNIKESRKEASEIIEKAKLDAIKAKEDIIAKTDEEIAAKRKQAEEDILRERKQAEVEIRDDIIDVALVATSTLLKREVSDDDNKKFLDDFITSLDKE